MFEFKPTYLYIKRHSITGKCYFGKTTKLDPFKYLGSGKYWRRHIRQYGVEFVETLWCKLFTDKIECVRIAQLFSVQQDIVNSDLWLNLKIEDGLNEGSNCRIAYTHSNETKRKMAEKATNRKHSPATKLKLSIIQSNRSEEIKHKLSIARKGKISNFKDHKHTAKSRLKMSESRRGNKNSLGKKNALGSKRTLEIRKKLSMAKARPQPIAQCPICLVKGGISNMKRWHFNNCKHKG